MTTAKTLFAGGADFAYGVAELSQLPPMSARMELAFAGRSNVGKSSLLNALTKRKALARTSKTPGCTQQLNFFTLGERAFLVDMPGYGYAKASKREVKGWNKLVIDYLRGRQTLRRVFLLIDSRHGVKDNDREIMRVLDDAAVTYQIVLTKCDKQSAAGLALVHEGIAAISKKHPALFPAILETSSETGDGMDALRGTIAELV